ncbi:hypothetical protein ABL78_2565 [Leptomonas seymouri]|uniref:EF-hand domain-containing protein n=1 Tax=Leptomonas seymouri TaxID=5684 RepID=A0A0N0P731_LEPSE|nr:hypothetical protein ABL78_2565 [Leptomonas seymouri]|eukprot:KPI88326.1 hypothetical protein ABL78_2565 [Leptomonas seymouri]
MSTLDPPADLGAIQQLETLFHSADPARTGLLSYSEFAYLILKSGGSQEQVDALIDQFTVPSRAQRMVCYAALLQQLSDSLKEDLSRGQSTPVTHPADITDHSPLPVPPPQTALHQHATTPSSLRNAEAAERRDSSSPYPDHVTSYSEQRIATSSPQLRSSTHAGSRSGSTATQGASIRSDRPNERRQQLFSDVQRGRSTTSGSPQPPFQLSSRFVASAVRTAQLQGTPGRSKGRRSEGSVAAGAAAASRSRSGTPLQGSSPYAWPILNGGGHQDGSRAFVPADVNKRVDAHTSAQHPPAPPPQAHSASASQRSQPSRSRSREDSFRRMTRAARDARCGGGNEKDRQAVHQSPTRWNRQSGAPLEVHSRPLTAPQLSTDTSLLSSSWHAHPELRSTRLHDSGLSSVSAVSKAPLLSLRTVFNRYVLPATSQKSGTVLLSDLESVFAAYGIEAHPLEVEAVADSLELQPDHGEANQSIGAGGTRVPLSTYNTSSSFATSTGSNTTVTGGADCALGLVDFCVLVSRLRPGLIQRIRSPATWHAHPTAAEVDGAHRGGGCGNTAAAAALPRRSTYRAATASDTDTAEGDSEAEGLEPSIADVTVSPMTPPPPTADATPQSHRDSPLQHRQRRDAPSSQPSTLVDARHQNPLQRQSLNEDDAPLRTARKLSSDRHFSVMDDRQAAPRLASPLGKEEQPTGYAQSTTSSQLHKRSQVMAPSSSIARPGGAAASQRRRKEAVWHTRLSSPSPRGAAAAASTKHRTSPFSPFSDTAEPPRSISRPSPQQRSAARRVSVSISSSPPSRRRETAQRDAVSLHSFSSPPPGNQQGRSTGVNVEGVRALALPPRLLDAMQNAASTILLHCTQLDTRRTGRIPTRAWPRVLRSSCPSLTDRERQTVAKWMAQLCQRHSSSRGDVYADVVEEIITLGSGPAKTLSPSPGGSNGSSAPSPSSNGSPRERSVTSTAAATTPAGSPFRGLVARAASRARESDNEEVSQRLRGALMAACGGDTDALQSYLGAFDEAHQGYLHDHLWRASLEELFRRTMSREAPQWVLDQCYRLSRLPFDRVAAQEQRGGAVPPASVAEKAACARVRRIPPNRRVALCDYHYVLQELGLDVPTQ